MGFKPTEAFIPLLFSRQVQSIALPLFLIYLWDVKESNLPSPKTTDLQSVPLSLRYNIPFWEASVQCFYVSCTLTTFHFLSGFYWKLLPIFRGCFVGAHSLTQLDCVQSLNTSTINTTADTVYTISTSKLLVRTIIFLSVLSIFNQKFSCGGGTRTHVWTAYETVLEPSPVTPQFIYFCTAYGIRTHEAISDYKIENLATMTASLTQHF